jgi:hypothetical protein
MKKIPNYFLNKAKEILEEKKKVNCFCKIYYGMGCYWYIKKDLNQNYQTFFLNYEEYHESNQFLKKFINGYIEVK